MKNIIPRMINRSSYEQSSRLTKGDQNPPDQSAQLFCIKETTVSEAHKSDRNLQEANSVTLHLEASVEFGSINRVGLVLEKHP